MSTELHPTNGNAMPQVSKIVSSYLKRNHLSPSDIEALRTALQEVVSVYLPEDTQSNQSTSIKVENLPMPENSEAQLRFTNMIKQPAVPIEDSICPDFIICLEDGVQVQSLGPYIKSRYALTPAQYREKWGLPAKYPMTAPNYSKKRAKSINEPVESSQEDKISSDLAVDTLDVPEPSTVITIELDNIQSGLAPEDLVLKETAPIAEADSAINDCDATASTGVTTIETPVKVAPISEATAQKPSQKSRPILKLAAWQKPSTPDVPADTKVIDHPIPPSNASEGAPHEEETPASANKADETPKENSSRGFRYPVHRYSR